MLKWVEDNEIMKNLKESHIKIPKYIGGKLIVH